MITGLHETLFDVNLKLVSNNPYIIVWDSIISVQY